MRKKPWFDLKSPFKVVTEIDTMENGDVIAQARVVDIYDPIGILPTDIAERNNYAAAKCHPDDEYNKGYGMRLASNRARMKLYSYIANRINERLIELDRYLVIIHNKVLKLREEHDRLLLEQMNFVEPENTGVIKEG